MGVAGADVNIRGAGAPGWDRFAHWPRGRARALLLALVAVLLASALVPLTVGKGEIATAPKLIQSRNALTERPRDDDLKLYDSVITRLRHGENYYSFIAEEQRKAGFPLRPGFAVRMPTLAYINAAMGLDGKAQAPLAMLAAVALMLGMALAWWRRLSEEACTDRQRLFGTTLMFFGASLGLNRYYFPLHELWAGGLLALSFGLHRPRPRGDGGKWLGALAAAALALAIREHALPFVLLMAGFALWRRAWREAAAWVLLVAAFGIALAIHLHIVAGLALPSDRLGPSWLVMRGLGGWLADIVLSSNLRYLPHWLAGPLVFLMILGWAGWRSTAGAFATLLYLGYGLGFMLAGRDENFYWGAMVAPAMFVGLAFLPMAAGSLIKAALPAKAVA